MCERKIGQITQLGPDIDSGRPVSFKRDGNFDTELIHKAGAFFWRLDMNTNTIKASEDPKLRAQDIEALELTKSALAKQDFTGTLNREHTELVVNNLMVLSLAMNGMFDATGRLPENREEMQKVLWEIQTLAKNLPKRSSKK